MPELLKLLLFQKCKFFFFLYNIRMVKFTRKENNTNTKIRSILRLVSAPAGYISRKVKSIYKKLLKKTDNNVEKLQKKSIDKLKGLLN